MNIRVSELSVLAEVSKWFEWSLFRACYRIDDKWRCLNYVVAAQDRERARFEFARRDPPFHGFEAFQTLDAGESGETSAVSGSTTSFAAGESSEVFAAGDKRPSNRKSGETP
jgi:hypothetical protein